MLGNTNMYKKWIYEWIFIHTYTAEKYIANSIKDIEEFIWIKWIMISESVIDNTLNQS